MSAAGEARSGMVTGYRSHPYHAPNRDWPETNCYVDVWIELLHHAGLEIAPLLPFTLAADFEGDQWTFYKPPHSDLWRLYGIEVAELTLWKDLVEHCRVQTALGRILLVEADAYHLPDTRGLDYQKSHSKTTIGIEAIDPERETLRYFHNRARFELSGSDYRGLFGRDAEKGDASLPPYCEIVKLDRLERRDPNELRAHSLDLLRTHRARSPETNPILRYGKVASQDLEALIAGNPDAYDLYAFAAIRQCGSCFGFSADYFRWLAERDPKWLAAAEPFARISSLSSMLILKMARVVHSGRLRDLSETFDEMSVAWDQGMQAVDRGLEG